MPGQPAAKITGAKELRKALRAMGDDLSDFTKLHRELAEIVAAEARQKVPVRSGKLQGSIKGKGYKTRARVQAGGTKLVPYAGPIHWGWAARNIEPQPFLTDALGAKAREIVRRYDERVDELIRKFDRETPG